VVISIITYFNNYFIRIEKVLFCRLCGKDSFTSSAPGSRGAYVLAWVVPCHLPGLELPA